MTTLALLGLIAIAIAVFLFVIEPILRAKSDQAVLDSAALPKPLDPRDIDAEALAEDETDDLVDPQNLHPPEPPAIAARRVSSDVV